VFSKLGGDAGAGAGWNLYGPGVFSRPDAGSLFMTAACSSTLGWSRAVDC